jgi:membrane protease YdiL (CAAX protease family)
MIVYIVSLGLILVFLLVLPKESFIVKRSTVISTLLAYSLIYLMFLEKSLFFNFHINNTSHFIVSLGFFVTLAILKLLIYKSLKTVDVIKCFIVILIPYLLSLLSFKYKFIIIDIFIFASFFGFLYFKVISMPLIKYKDLTEIDGFYLIYILYLYYLYLVYREINIGYLWSSNISHWSLTLVFSLLAVIICLIIGYCLKFVRFTGFKIDLRNIFLLVIFMFFFVTLIEEFFFRGLLINYFNQIIIPFNMILPLFISTVIFGAAHINGGKKMFIISSIAGFFFGITYILTQNIICAASAHTIVNVIWQLFFKLGDN